MEQQLVYIGVVLVVVLGSMILHELMHGLVAYWLGDSTAKDNGRLSLNPLKHLDWFMSILLPLMLAISGGPIFGGAKPVPIDGRRLKGGEWGFALVGIAGPLTNLLIAFVGYAVWHYLGAGWTGIGEMIVMNVVWVNLGFAVFNMLPIPPLDGSRVLYALAPEFVRRVMMQMERWGIVIVLMLVVFFNQVFSGIMLGAIRGILGLFDALML
jgi:Zn-dependent protease